MDMSIKELISKYPGISAERLCGLLEAMSSIEETIPAATKSAVFGRLRRLKRAGHLINKGSRWYFARSPGNE
jgi:hypothetical protein